MQSENRKIAENPTDIERLLAESERLASVCTELHESLDEAGAIAMVCRAARNVTGADGACIILREGERVHYAHEDTIAPLWAGRSFPITDCISGWSILHRATVVIPDIYSDERIPADYYRPTYVKALAIQPIEASHPIGAIGVYWDRVHEATRRELRLLEKLAGAAAIALSYVRVREQLRSTRDKASRFLATTSHELRSSLNAITGWADVIRTANLDQSVLSHAIEVIKRNATAHERLIDDLLDVSRIASGKIHLELHVVEIGSVVAEAVENAYPLSASKNITLELAAGAAPCYCQGDPIRLQQVMCNLLTNAIKFTPDGGLVLVSIDRTASHAKVTVTDTGRGIASDFLPHIFEPFRQADDADEMERVGLGLGLALARDIVQMHAGTIEAYSAGSGQGAALTVVLPLSGGNIQAA
jgi:signal transduction histidine kinase